MDFMNLNQSAHGDREFGYVETRLRLRRKTVVGHWHDPRGRGAHRHLGSRRGRLARGAAARRSPASATTCAASPSPRATRSRRSSGSASRSTATAWRARRGRRRGRRRRGATRLVAEYEEQYELAPELRSGGRRPARVAARRRPHRGGPARLPRRRRLPRLHRHVRGPRRAAAAAGDRGAAADGRRLRLRGRRRLEDGRARPHREGDERRASTAARRSWRTTPTTSRRPARRCSARTCSRSARRSPRGRPACEIHPLSIGGKADPVRLVFTAAPGPAMLVGLLDLGDRFRLVLNEVETSSSRSRSCRACRWRGRCGRRSRTSPTAAEAWLDARAARTTRCSATRSARRRSPTSRRSPGSSCW